MNNAEIDNITLNGQVIRWGKVKPATIQKLANAAQQVQRSVDIFTESVLEACEDVGGKEWKQQDFGRLLSQVKEQLVPALVDSGIMKRGLFGNYIRGIAATVKYDLPNLTQGTKVTEAAKLLLEQPEYQKKIEQLAETTGKQKAREIVTQQAIENTKPVVPTRAPVVSDYPTIKDYLEAFDKWLPVYIEANPILIAERTEVAKLYKKIKGE